MKPTANFFLGGGGGTVYLNVVPSVECSLSLKSADFKALGSQDCYHEEYCSLKHHAL
jgi:hypothetical protein